MAFHSGEVFDSFTPKKTIDCDNDIVLEELYLLSSAAHVPSPCPRVDVQFNYTCIITYGMQTLRE